MKIKKQQSLKVFIIWTGFIILGVLFLRHYENKTSVMVKDFNYPKFLQAVENKQIKPESVVFNLSKKVIVGELNESGAKKYSGKSFQIEGNVDDKGFELVRAHGITPSYSNSDGSIWTSILINWLPILLFAGLFIFFIRQLQAGGSKALSFGKSKAKLQVSKGKITFKDVAGVEEAKEELSEVVDFLRHPKKFTKLGGRIPKGILLVGAPGTGKTLLARAVAGEADVPFFTISGSDFVEMFVGVGASRVRDLFLQGKKHSPCLIFIDEIDAVGRHRGAGLGGGHDEREQTLNQLLVEMDGFESKEGIILIAATNRPDVLDPALLRPGRFDRRVSVSPPDLNGREQILKVHTKKVPLDSGVNLNVIARGTPGFSGADLENLINEGCLHAAKNNQNTVLMKNLEFAKDKVMMGSERRSMMISEKDKKITAYHEAGHTIVGCHLKGLDPIHKVTIIPRGMALGITQTLPVEDALSFTRSKAINTLAFLFGGRAAEELIFKDFTTGAGNDIERATELARRMVCEWGMSDKLGAITFEKRESPVFLGMQGNQSSKDYSDSKAREIDAEIDALLKGAHNTAREVLKKSESILHAMSQALLEYETINGAEVGEFIKGTSFKDFKKKKEEQIQAAAANENLKSPSPEKKKDSKKKSTSISNPIIV